MNRKTSRFPMLIIILICFVVGALSVYLNVSNRISIFPQATPTVPPSVTHQKTALILGVDDLSLPEPRLLAVWFASFRFPEKEIFLYGLPTDYAADVSSPSLADLFQWHGENGVAKAFLVALQEIHISEPNVILVLDEQGFATLIDYLTGVPLGGSSMDGETVVNALRFFYEDPSQSLEAQTKILRALVERVQVLGDTLDLTDLFNLIPDHAYCSEPPSLVATTFGLLLPLRKETIFITQWPLNPEEQSLSSP
ncbi:MAG: hypothetical protein GTO14_15185 [Anaerolineales bacterium]|nr:hypothetical protein [Anaerolineales bacterium]